MDKELVINELKAKNIETSKMSVSSTLIGDSIIADDITANSIKVNEKNPDGQEYATSVATQSWVNAQNYSHTKIYDENGNTLPNMNVTTTMVTDIYGNKVLAYIVPIPQQ